jgi:hypothetical protein
MKITTAIITLVLAALCGTAHAATLSPAESRKHLSYSYPAYRQLELCYLGSLRAIERDELAKYADIMERIEYDARKVEPGIDLYLARLNAVRADFRLIGNPARSICDRSRVIVMLDYWSRKNTESFFKLHAMFELCERRHQQTEWWCDLKDMRRQELLLPVR